MSTPPLSPSSARTPDTADLRPKERQEGWAVPIDQIDAFTLGAALSVEPERIEQELSAMWRKAAERARQGGVRFSVTRACLWNLVIHSDGEEQFLATKRLLDEVSESIPARIIDLYETWEPEESAGPTPVRAFIEANFRRSGDGRREILAEEITLEAPRIAGPRLAGLVRSLLLPDVPTALFVRNPSADYHWLPRLAPEADRLIFDSGSLPSAAALHRVYALLGRMYVRPEVSPTPRCDIADLGWLRLWPWRSLIASLFDPPAATQHLAALSSLVIRHRPGAEPAAWLLAGWLCDRLSLVATAEASPPETRRLRKLSAPDRTVTLRLEEVHCPETPAGVVDVALHSDTALFTAHAQPENRCVKLSGPLQPDRIQPVHQRPDVDLVIAAMGVGGRDPLMYEALRAAVLLFRNGHV